PGKLSWGSLDLRSVKGPKDLPEEFNLAAALLDRHLAEGRGARMALRGPAGNLTYEQLYRLTNQAGHAFRSLGLQREQRVLLLLRDSPEFIACFLAAMKIGAVPVGLNTFAHPSDYEFYIQHSRARLLVGEAEFLAPLEPTLQRSSLRAVLSVRGEGIAGAYPFQQIVSAQPTELDPAPTHRDDPSHWVYTSGSTGEAKAAVHLHRNTLFSIEPYVRHVLQMTPDDISFSVARLFFSYGLANSLFMPLWVGAGVVLLPERPEPDCVVETIAQYRPTLFYSVPTAYGRMLREIEDWKKLSSLRLCISAGEALPAPIYLAWKEKTGLEIMDGVGSTEFGYIFLTNRPGQVHLGSSGTVLPEHKSRLVDESGNDVSDTQMGELWMSSPSIASYYFRNHAASKRTFIGDWLRTGDQYARNEQGALIYQGRTDDLFKSGGIWVSPIQVESTLLEHPAVAEASVVAERDQQGLEKPVAYVVLKAGGQTAAQMEHELREFTKNRLAPYKCPKAFYFVSDLPKTASGKIQRFKLRQQAASEKSP
ncbi:MAG: benzoate-CoA ligase family protein, partial [Acidobacteria bacterium]|nr:benzoate-CoA ligase family protein [Acidobacteriota bacterium]